MTSSKTLQTIKQNFAAFAIATIALTGLTAITPAQATVYASTAGSVADPNRSFTYHNTGTALDGNSQTTFTVPANTGLRGFRASTTLTQAQSTALQGQTITFEYSLKNASTNAVISGGGTNPSATVNSGYVAFAQNSSPSVVWPGTTGTSDSLSIFVNYEIGASYANGALVPAGSYLATLKFFANGTLISGTWAAPTLTFAALAATSGTVPAGSTFDSIVPGYVCVNPSLISAGDVLTARPMLDGALLNNTSGNAYWNQGGNGSGTSTMMTNTRTVLASDITHGLAYKNNGISAVVTAGTPFVFDLSIQNANGTEVTYPCPTVSVATPVITSSSSTQVVFTVANASPTTMCSATQSIVMNGNTVSVPAGFGSLSGTTCTVNPNMSTFSAGTYAVRAMDSGFWNTAISTNNPTFTIAGSSPSNNAPSGGTVTANPATPSYSNGVLTATSATWQNASVNKRTYWLVCASAHPAASGDSSNSRPSDCAPTSATALTAQSPTWLNTNPYTIPATVNKLVSCVISTCTTTSLSTVGLYYTWYEFDSGNWTMSATVGADGSSAPVVSLPVLSAEQARNIVKPLPVIVQPLVAALPQLSKPMFNQGGKLALTAGDFSGLVSASISGKPLDLSVATNGGLTITVPNGEAGKTADLFLNFTSGTVIIQDAIKYVAPFVVADVPVRPVSIAAGSTKLNDATADQVRQAAFANMKNTTISCVAYAASGSAAARAAAIASAEQVCALATKANPALTATPVTVIVDKAKAKTSAVGIKVYKASN